MSVESDPEIIAIFPTKELLDAPLEPATKQEPSLREIQEAIGRKMRVKDWNPPPPIRIRPRKPWEFSFYFPSTRLK